MTTASWCCRISWQRVVSTTSSPPGTRPNAVSSRTAQQTHRCSVTRATAAKPMPVDRQATSRMRGTAEIPRTAAISVLKSVAMISFLCEPRQTLAQPQSRVEKSVMRELKQNPQLIGYRGVRRVGRSAAKKALWQKILGKRILGKRSWTKDLGNDKPYAM